MDAHDKLTLIMAHTRCLCSTWTKSSLLRAVRRLSPKTWRSPDTRYRDTFVMYM